VRNLFSNATYCPFGFAPEQVRVLSGEEEAIYDWAGVNFLMGDLIEQSEGAGTVINPRRTHGALDLGGASAQISFYESKEDIMSNLFKLQIGQAKHWNVYAHSFLYYGMEEALHRFQARLAANKSTQQRLVEGVYSPCLPGKTRVDFRSNLHLADSSTSLARMETWNYTEGAYPSGDGSYQAIMKNDNDRGDPDKCLSLAKDLLHLEQNQWCNFDHKGECSFAGVYQPQLPQQSDSFGEFLAFSNYYDVWHFLHLPERATIAQLEKATRYACSLSWDELVDYAPSKFKTDEALDSFCFRSAYVYQLLHNGFGFQDDNIIRAVRVISGMRVDWALGAMLYEINALPWSHEQEQQQQQQQPPQQRHQRKNVRDYNVDYNRDDVPVAFLVGTVIAMCICFLVVVAQRERRRRRNQYAQYEPIKEVSV
jgi:GDA1/CD39 (nucleoside phosphatase) family